MATVYRVFDERLRVHRALKMLSPEMTLQAAIRRRFENEAHTMARLSHPNIVSVHDVGDDGEQVYIVMELIEGGSLMDHLDRHGVMDERTAVELCIGVLRGLQVAHDNGVVHRDIKPHNVLLAADGTPKVTDFGIARIQTDDNSGMTRTGSVIGTWAFMAPEQRAGARDLDRRADIYSVVATLVTLVTRNLPGDLFVSELHRKLLVDVPECLWPIIQRATRYDAADRYSTASEMAAAFEALLPSLPPIPFDRPKLGLPVRIMERPVRRHAAETMSLAGGTLEPEAGSKDTLAPQTVGPISGSSNTQAASLVLEPEAVSPPRGRNVKLLVGGVLLGLLGAASVGVYLTVTGTPSATEAVAPAVDASAPTEPPGTERTLLAANEPVTTPTPAAAPAAAAAPPVVAPPPAAPPAHAAAKTPKPAAASEKPAPAVAKIAADPPAPVAAAPVAAAPAAPVAEAPGRFNVSGDATNVRLSDGSKTWSAGEIPAGTYSVLADFPGVEGVKAGSVKIAAGERVTIHCDGSFQRCKR